MRHKNKLNLFFILFIILILLSCNLPGSGNSPENVEALEQDQQPFSAGDEETASEPENEAQNQAEAAPRPEADLVQPEDLVYVGAFRLPAPSGDSNWDYSGTALTWYPDGDPQGAADGFPGSLYGAGHDQQLSVSEISIPLPVISDNLEDLNTAETLQPFADITGGLFNLSSLEIPNLGLAYLPGETGGQIHFTAGQHFQGFDPSQGVSGLDLSHPQAQGPWTFDGITNYASNDYLLAVPQEWTAAYAPGKRLSSGRFREGVWGGLGPALFLYDPAEGERNGEIKDVIPLLLYGTQEPNLPDIVSDPSQAMLNYQEADHWLGAAWLVKDGRSALVFTGTKALGRSWYGFANGIEWAYDCAEQTPPTCPDVPEWPYDNRGYWAEDYQGQILFFDPAELGQVTLGEMETWEPQPYAALDLTPYLYQPELNHAEYKRDLIGAAAFDEQNGFLYVFERLADEYQSIIHVWQVR